MTSPGVRAARLGPFFVAWLLGACTLPEADAADPGRPVTLRAVGADSMASLMACWTAGFESRYPAISVDFVPGLSAKGADAMLDGTADISPYARELFPNEALAFRERFGRQPPLVAVAGGSYANRGKTHAIAIHVNAANPIESLSWSDLHRIFAGKPATTWGDLGLEGPWASAPVNVYGMLNLRDTGNPPGIVNYLRRVFNAGAPLNDSIRQLAGDERRHALQQIVDAVAGDKHGIGYSGFGFGTDGARSVPLELDDLPVAGTPDSARDFEYLLSRSIYVAMHPALDAKKRAAALDFLDFVLGPAGQGCIEADPAGFTPLPDEILERQQDRLDYLAMTGGTELTDSNKTHLTRDGRIRVVGYNDMDQMLTALNEHFAELKPDVGFEMILEGTRTAPPALIDGSSAFAPMGAEFSDAQLAAFRDGVGGDPVAVRVAHSSLSPKALSGPLALFVNAANPLENISLATARRIFGAIEDGHRIDTWGQLGLGGEWAGRKIQPCGLAPHTALASFFRRRALDGLELADDVAGFAQSSDAVEHAGANRDALCFAAFIRREPGVRALAVSATEDEPAIAITAGNIIGGRYPLDRFLYIYLREPLNRDRDPLLYDYLQMVLSPAGQAIIAAGERGYLPLNAADLAAERLKAFGRKGPQP